MNDYKILAESWTKFITQDESINEVTEEELSDIDDVLMDLKPEDLAFNNIFGDKMRIITSMQTKDKNLEYLKKILKESGYVPNFATGLATYHVLNLPGGFDAHGDPKKPSTMILNHDQAQPFTDETWRKEHPDAAQKVQKKQVKIGKLLQKGSRLFDIAKKSQNEFEKVKPTDYPEDKYVEYRRKSMELESASEKDLGKLMDTFQGFKSRAVSDTNPFQHLAGWWNKKSTFYRENPEAAETGLTVGENSIIYSRHPIDVLRMSDFDNIESCHSPISRGGGATYYKCAVAEAHAHGFIAYAVKNEDLLNLLADYEEGEAKDLQGLLDFYQAEDKELFFDQNRDIGDISPIARLRVKKYTNPSLEVTLAVPEERVYQASGEAHRKKYGVVSRDVFVKDVVNWTREKQPKVIKKIVDSKNSDNPYEAAIDETDYLELGKWERHGGTYQDTSDSSLFYNILEPDIKGTRGSVHVDSTTEDNLEIDGGLIERWQNEVNEMRDDYNRRMQAIRITRVDVEDDGAGEAYIAIHAELKLVFSESDFVTSAFQNKTRKAIEYLPQELIDYGFDWLNDYVSYSTLNPRSQDWDDLIRQVIDEEQVQIVVEIPIDIEQVNPEGGAYAYNPDNFQDICLQLDQKDDDVEAVKEIAAGYLKRQGVLKGGGLFQLASALTDESWYEWSHEIDDEYNPASIEIETATDVNFNDLIKQIPITFDYQPDKSSEVFIMFAGDPLALASKTHGGEDYSFKGFEVRSPEFETEMMDGFMSLDAVKEYVQWEVAKLILRPKGQISDYPPGLKRGVWQSSRDYLVAVSTLMRDAADGKEGEFMYPNRSMWVSGPDSEDEYRMVFSIRLDDGDSDEVVANAHKIIVETDDEDKLKEIFKIAFAKVAKIPGAAKTLQEVKQYFSKFDLF